MLRATFGITVGVLALLGASVDVQAQPPGGAGRRVFETRCAVCHGNDGHGGDTGPSIVYRLPLLRALREHHARHHHPELMQKSNFNVTIPLGDMLFGTFASAATIEKITQRARGKPSAQ